MTEDDDLKRLLTPPRLSSRIELDGIRWPDPIEHPELQPAFMDFHDRLSWSRDLPPMGAEGIELFLLVSRCLSAGHPILAMPPTRIAAAQVWDAFMLLLGPDIRAMLRKAQEDTGERMEYLPAVLTGNTIHGTKTLLKNVVNVRRKLVKAFKNPTAGIVQFENFADPAMKSVI